MFKITFAPLLTVTLTLLAGGPIRATPGNDWPLFGGNFGQWQFSPLNLITAGNVAGLLLARSAQMPVVQGLVGNPLVVDGTVYQGAPGGRIIASDLRTG
jgi:quinohemoprotein ethanol dehydrogenase